MVMTLLSSGPGFAAFTDRWRIPKADVQRLRDAGQLLAAASDRANRAEARAADQEAQARQRGYEAGLREGRAAGAAEAAHALTAVVREVRAGQNELKESLGALSLDVVRRVAARPAAASGAAWTLSGWSLRISRTACSTIASSTA